MGTYQVTHAASYIQDKLYRGDTEDFVIDVQHEGRTPIPGLIRVQAYSRFSNAKKHKVWIQYQPVPINTNEVLDTSDTLATSNASLNGESDSSDEMIRNQPVNDDSREESNNQFGIEGCYSQCKSGARTVGASVTSLLCYGIWGTLGMNLRCNIHR